MVSVVRVEGVEPSSHAWEAHIIAGILYPRDQNAVIKAGPRELASVFLGGGTRNPVATIGGRESGALEKAGGSQLDGLRTTRLALVATSVSEWRRCAFHATEKVAGAF